MAAKVMTGARAYMEVADLNGDNPSGPIGIFNSISWSLAYDVQPIWILGRLNPAETVYTGQEPVSVTASGWRVIDHGAHVDGHVPTLAQLLQHEYITLSIVDRVSGAVIAKIEQCRPTGYNTSLAARSPEDISVSFIGLLVSDESGSNTEAANGFKITDLP
jgi:hypothetical protein